MKILLTGISGFLGSRLAEVMMSNSDIDLTGVTRDNANLPVAKIVQIKTLNGNTDWSKALTDQRVVIHCAAAYIMKDKELDPLTEYRKVNVDGSLNLARQAAQAGTNRFIFISSIKVNGENTAIDKPFNAEEKPMPKDPYSISKWEAEQGLQQLASETNMEVVIIRSPLIYGPGVKGNFASMMKLVKKGLPLPLGAIHNKRTLVALDNLVDLIVTCIYHPAASNQTFLAGDDSDFSTTELLKGLARAGGKPSRLVPLPSSFLMFAASLLGKKEIAQRLLGSLQVDISKAQKIIGWKPPISVEDALRRCFLKG